MAAPKKKSPAEIQKIIDEVTAAGRKIYKTRYEKKFKSGLTHVYEILSYYDPVTKNNKRIDSKLLGKFSKDSIDTNNLESTDKKYSSKKVALADVAPNVDDVPDTRAAERVMYPLDVVLFVILLAQMAGYSSCYAIAEFWKAQKDVLSKLLKNFPEKDISHDTVRRIIKLLGGQDAVNVIRRFTDPLVQFLKRRIISMDGQAVRAAIKEDNGAARYVLNVFANEDQLCLNQVYIGPKENEITQAINALSGMNIRGAVVTTDALNTQKNLCQFVLDQGADYCFALKQNHKNLYGEVSTWFQAKSLSAAVKEISRDDDGHGRKEHRVYRVLPANSNKLLMEYVTEWPGLEDGCVVETTTTRISKKTGEKSVETRYFITSLYYDELYIAEAVAHAIRGHWGIENSLHWTLDVTMNQDRTQCRNAEFLNGKTSMNKVSFNLFSKIQALLEEESGKKAPSKRALMAKLSNLSDAVMLIAKLYDHMRNEEKN